MKQVNSICFQLMVATCSLLILNCNSVRAQKDEWSVNKTLSPYFVVFSDNPETDQLPLKENRVKASIIGAIADVNVRQVFVNNGKNALEAIYTFPMSVHAAVYGMQMTIGGRTVKAKIEEKQKAKAIYEKAKTDGKRASLMEQSRPNVFTMNVSNIMPGDTVVVDLNYTELLVPENGQYAFVYPTVVGPRYSNKSAAQAPCEDQFVASPYTKHGVMPTYQFGYELTLNSAVPIQSISCGTHKMNIRHNGLKQAVVTLDPSEVDGGNRDVIVNYSLQGNKIELGMMLYDGKDGKYFLFMAQPPKRVAEADIPPREYVFIVDVSGSMHGFPLDVSKRLMRNLILGLRHTDKFNVVLFSGASAVMSRASVNATSANVERAMNFIDDQQGGGGTEIMDALRMAYAIPRPDSRVSRTFVMVTDGFVSVEREAFDLIRSNSNGTNFFSFGIGSSVNRYLIEGMALAGNGEPMIVTKEEEAETQAEMFRNYISTPVLTHIRVNTGAFHGYDMEPLAYPDMMAERPILIFGKYTGEPKGMVTITGKTGRGIYTQSFDLSTVKPEAGYSALRYLWARERIKRLGYGVKVCRGNVEGDAATIKEITQLGLACHLMTDYTSFIAIDEHVVNNDGKRITVQQPIPLPEGVSNLAVGEDGSGYLGSRATGSFSVQANSCEVPVCAEPVSAEELEGACNKVFDMVEQAPSFPGGSMKLNDYIRNSIRYPKIAREKGVQGRVIVSFVVEKDGSISQIEVKKSVDPALDREAVRVVSTMPRWIPGKQNGQCVPVHYNVPIVFNLSAK